LPGAAPLYEVDVVWSDATGGWTFPGPSEGAWHHLVVTYDASSTANDPLIYVDGEGVTVARLNSPLGTITPDTSGNLTIGNRVAGSYNRGWDGMLADVAVWNRILAPWEARLLGGTDHVGVNWFPTSLAEYVFMPDVGAPESFLGGPTVTGTAAQPSPPINYVTEALSNPWPQRAPLLAH
jgi:hypothetical protein